MKAFSVLNKSKQGESKMKKKKAFAAVLGSILIVILCAGAVLLAVPAKRALPSAGEREQEVKERKEREGEERKEREGEEQKAGEQKEWGLKKREEGGWGEQEKNKRALGETVIHYRVVYNMEITSVQMAAEAIVEEGQRQRENYDNPQVERIELKMEEEFGIFAVNLGEMSLETAKAVYEGFSYMYEKYPCLQKTLTNLTLGNMGNRTGGTVALTDRMIFVVNGDYGNCPFVEKYCIVLNARVFLDDERLEKTCRNLAESGYWPKGANVSSILVHELGHQLQNVIVQKKFGLECPYYITEENLDAFSLYNTDRLSLEGNITEEILNRAYEMWREVYGNKGEYEEFVRSISEYAMGDEKEEKYSPSETFAEAVADVYLNGENAADASKAITKIIDEILTLEGDFSRTAY